MQNEQEEKETFEDYMSKAGIEGEASGKGNAARISMHINSTASSFNAYTQKSEPKPFLLNVHQLI